MGLTLFSNLSNIEQISECRNYRMEWFSGCPFEGVKNIELTKGTEIHIPTAVGRGLG